jgi:ABC-type phosphate transport system permease subunit
MKLSVWAVACALAVFWGAAVLIVGVANALWPSYGHEFLQVMASLYPGYKGTPGVGQALVGTLYAVVDGAVAGAIFAWIYNYFVARFARLEAP